MSVYKLKSKFQNLLRPVSNVLVKMGLTPNQITLTTCLLSVAYSGLIFYFPHSNVFLFGLPLFMFFRMALNAIDGMMAKEHGMVSKMGTILNEITDVIADSSLYLAFCALPGMPKELLVSFTVLAVISEMTGVVAIQVGSERRYDGPMGKSDRATVFAILALLTATGLLQNQTYTIAFVLILNIMVAWTILNRARNSIMTQSS